MLLSLNVGGAAVSVWAASLAFVVHAAGALLLKTRAETDARAGSHHHNIHCKGFCWK
jgi:hypothetical protein